MNLLVEAPSQQIFNFKTSLPAGYYGPRLAGGNVLFSEGDYGTICLQEINQDDFFFNYSVKSFSKELVLKESVMKVGVFARVVLENHFEHVLDEAGALSIREGQFTLVKASNPQAMVSYRPERRYSCFDTYFSPRAIQDILPLYPSLVPLLGNMESQQSKILIQPSRPASLITHELINDTLFEYPREHSEQQPFFAHKSKQLLEQFLAELNFAENPINPTSKQLDAIYRAEELIANDIRQHFLIPELARKAGTNNFTLKTVFKFVFGLGPYQYLIRKRMRKAKELLQQGYSVKEVAAKTGYRTTGEFTKAFKRYFGNEVPSSFLRKNE